MATEQPACGPRVNGRATAGRAVPIRESAALTANWVASRVIGVQEADRCALRFKYSAAASASNARPQIRVMTSAEFHTDGTAPLVSHDVWYPATLIDPTQTLTLLTGTKETGATGTITQPEHAVQIIHPGAWTLGEPSDAATDVWHLKLVFDVSDDLFLYVAAKELGDTSHLGTLQIKANIR